MILFDLINNIFESFPLLLAGYSIFTQPGTGSNTGKLSFKSIIAGTGISITSGTSSLSISDNNSQIQLGVISKRVAIGTGTGITGSTIVSVCNGGIIGAKMLSYESPASISIYDCTSDKSGFLIGGCCNTIFGGPNSRSVIMGGFCNRSTFSDAIISTSFKSCTSGFNCRNVIIGASGSCIQQSSYNIIIGGTGTTIDNGASGTGNHTIINSNIWVNSTDRQTIIGSYAKYQLYSGAANVSIISSKDFTPGGYSDYSSLISSNNSKLPALGAINSIVSTNNSCIFGYGPTSSIGVFLTGDSNCALNSCYSSILGSDSDICNSKFSSILNGSEPVICNSQTSVIISSALDYISNSKYSSILGSINNSCVFNSCYSSVLGGFSNIIKDSIGSTINGSSNDICASCHSFISGRSNKSIGKTFSVTIGTSSVSNNNSVIFGNCNCIVISSTSSISNNLIIGLECNSILSNKGLTQGFINNSILGTCLNTITQSGTSPTTDNFSGNFINGNENTIFNGRLSGILGSCDNLICCSNSSVIIGSNNSVIHGNDNNAIIGSVNACIIDSRRSAIIGATGSLNGVLNTTKVNLVRIFGDVSTLAGTKVDGLAYCSITSGKIVLSISVRNGIITSITTN